MHRDVMASHHRMVALDTNSRFLAAAAGFGGGKAGDHLQRFYAVLADLEAAPAEEPRTVSMAQLVAMGREAAAEHAAASEEERVEREARDATIAELFEKHRPGGRPVA